MFCLAPDRQPNNTIGLALPVSAAGYPGRSGPERPPVGATPLRRQEMKMSGTALKARSPEPQPAYFAVFLWPGRPNADSLQRNAFAAERAHVWLFWIPTL